MTWIEVFRSGSVCRGKALGHESIATQRRIKEETERELVSMQKSETRVLLDVVVLERGQTFSHLPLPSQIPLQSRKGGEKIEL